MLETSIDSKRFQGAFSMQLNITAIPFYVYKITLVSTGQYYVGSRFRHVRFKRDPNRDLWNRYFTSSELIKKLINYHGKQAFWPEIIYQSTDFDQTYWYEQDMIKNHINDRQCLNQYYVDSATNKQVFNVYGTTTWVKDGKLVFQKDCPGEGWTNTNLLKGITTWVKDANIVFAHESPGEGWSRGSQANGKKFWKHINGDMCRSKVSPGLDWLEQGPHQGKKLWLHPDGTALLAKDSPGPMWGNQPRSRGTCWISSDGNFQYGHQCPGDGWVRQSYNKGRQHWINYTGEIKFEHQCPGEGWNPHNLNKGRKLWINQEGLRKKSITCPGEGWKMHTSKLTSVS